MDPLPPLLKLIWPFIQIIANFICVFLPYDYMEMIETGVQRSGVSCLACLALACVLLLSACSATSLKRNGRSADDVKATALRAEQSYANAEWATAADAYAVLVKEMPQDTNLWFRYANALARSDQPDQAVAAYREVVVRDAHSSKAWFNMGIVQLRQAANSFSRMGSNVTAEDPMRSQGEQVYGEIMKILGDDSGAKAAGPATGATVKAKSGPVAPTLPSGVESLTPPVTEHDAGGGARH